MFGRVEVMKRSLLEKAVRGQLASFHDRFDMDVATPTMRITS